MQSSNINFKSTANDGIFYSTEIFCKLKASIVQYIITGRALYKVSTRSAMIYYYKAICKKM